MNSTTHIPVVFSSNDYFVPYMATMMQSIMENANRNRSYCFFVLYREISTNSIDLLKKQIGGFSHFNIEFIDVTRYIKGHNFFIGTHNKGITIETYFRLFISRIFSSLGYDKVIYLDGDMICLTDIAELFDIDIEPWCLASSRDIMGIGCYYSGVYKYVKPQKGYFSDRKFIIKNIDNYFNAGMIVFNIKQFNKMYSIEQILEFATSKKWICHDQDVLNVLFEGKIFLLPMKWNYTEEENMELHAPGYIQDEYFDAKNNPKIIHYCKNKPWKIFYYGANFHHFWVYASKTPFLETILNRMNKEKLITSTSYANALVRDVKNAQGPGIKTFLKCAFIKFIKTKLKNNFQGLNFPGLTNE